MCVLSSASALRGGRGEHEREPDGEKEAWVCTMEGRKEKWEWDRGESSGQEGGIYVIATPHPHSMLDRHFRLWSKRQKDRGKREKRRVFTYFGWLCMP